MGAPPPMAICGRKAQPGCGKDCDWHKLWCRFGWSSASGLEGHNQKRTACTSET